MFRFQRMKMRHFLSTISKIELSSVNYMHVVCLQGKISAETQRLMKLHYWKNLKQRKTRHKTEDDDAGNEKQEL